MSLPDSCFFAVLTPTAVIVVLVVILLVFGGKKLPELARGLGKALREFKKARDEIDGEVNAALDEEDERKKIRARLEAEERAKFEAEKHAAAAKNSAESATSNAETTTPKQ